ncbi:MAG: radical SAM protein [Thermoplasmata archaeon]
MPPPAVHPDVRGPRRDWPRYLGLAASMIRSRLVTHRPFFLAHAATFGCNSKCQTCSYWKLTPRMKEDLSTEEVYSLLDEAHAAGMRGYYLFGGEPLVRKDIGEIVSYARRRGFLTTMNTNGSLLTGKAESLRDLDIAFVSLDYPTPYHDEIRGRVGSFDEVVHGIQRLRAVAGTRVVLVSTISTLNFDAIEPMAQLAQRLDVGISYNSIEPTLDFGMTDSVNSPNLRFGLSPAKLQTFYETLVRVKAAGYPLMETEQVLRDFVEGRPWRCEFPEMFVYVTPDKKIETCDYARAYDLKHGSFEEYFAGPGFRAHAQAAKGCNRCVRTCVRNYAYTYQLKFGHIAQLAGETRRLYQPVAPAPRPTVPIARRASGLS